MTSAVARHSSGRGRPSPLEPSGLGRPGSGPDRDALPGPRLERLESAVHVAQCVQRAFLPERAVRRAGTLEIAGLNEFCEHASGDYYDVLDLSDGRIAVPVGDASGHGLGPALVMAQARSSLRAFSDGLCRPPRVMARLNDALAPDLCQGRFMSLLVTVLHPRTGAVEWCNAGHVPALLLRASTGSVERLEATGPVLGVVRGARYAAGRRLTLDEGDVLLLCSDGATEVVDGRGERFGDDRVARVLRSTATWGAESIISALRAALRTFMGDGPLHDDLTLVAIRRTEPARGAPPDPRPASIRRRRRGRRRREGPSDAGAAPRARSA